MQLEQFNIEAYKALREEIKMRLDSHFKLVFAKFGLCGGLFAYIASNSKTPVSPYLISAIFSFLFDVVILENLGTVRRIGSYIKNCVEKTELLIIKWETESAQIDDRWQCFHVAGYLCGTWSIGALLVLGYFILEFNPQDKVNIALFIGSLYLAAYSTFLSWSHLAAYLGGKYSPSPINNRSGDR